MGYTTHGDPILGVDFHIHLPPMLRFRGFPGLDPQPLGAWVARAATCLESRTSGKPSGWQFQLGPPKARGPQASLLFFLGRTDASKKGGKAETGCPK